MIISEHKNYIYQFSIPRVLSYISIFVLIDFSSVELRARLSTIQRSIFLFYERKGETRYQGQVLQQLFISIFRNPQTSLRQLNKTH
jgi:hypothetical protein